MTSLPYPPPGQKARLASVRLDHYDGDAMVLPGHLGQAEVEQAGQAEYRGEQICAEHVYWHFQPRVMWCERHGDPCDLNGEWHGHWHAVVLNDDQRTHFTVIHPASDR